MQKKTNFVECSKTSMSSIRQASISHFWTEQQRCSATPLLCHLYFLQEVGTVFSPLTFRWKVSLSVVMRTLTWMLELHLLTSKYKRKGCEKSIGHLFLNVTQQQVPVKENKQHYHFFVTITFFLSC